MKRFVIHIFFDVMKSVHEFCGGKPCSPFILLEKAKLLNNIFYLTPLPI